MGWRYPKSIFTVLGAFWLVIDPAIGLTGKSINLKYWQLLLFSAMAGILWMIIDGYYISGFFRKSIQIMSNGFDTKIIVEFADMFCNNGWKAIAVNDFFDSIVDNKHIAERSVHGNVLKKYWGGNINDWDTQVAEQLKTIDSTTVSRASGKQQRYDIGSTAAVTTGGNKFLFVALTHTDINTLQTKADSSDLNKALRGLLTKARSVCANEPINIPLMGSGLARTGIKSNILVDLILTAVFEETKFNKISDEIRIVLPTVKMSEINLISIKQNWS